MPLPLIVFDFDGTLAATFPLAMETFNRLAPIHQFEPVTDWERARALPTRAFFRQHGIRIWKLGRFVRAFQEQMRLRAAEIEMVPGMAEAIRALHGDGHRLGILSSNAEGHIRERLDAFGIAGCFEFVTSYPKLFGKAKVLKRLSRGLGIPKGEIAYVGDEFRDVEAAQKAGVRAVGVSWGYHAESLLEQAAPEVLCREPSELLAWLRGQP